MENEDTLDFIEELCSIVHNFPFWAITEEQLRMKCFPFAMKDRVKTWYRSLPANSLNIWSDICKKFMLKFFPIKKTHELQSKIMHFSQERDEPFHEAWERFQGLLQKCPHHKFESEMLQ